MPPSTTFRFRIQHLKGPDPLDPAYSSLRAAKGQLTVKARRYRSFGYIIVDRETDERFIYDRASCRVVPYQPQP